MQIFDQKFRFLIKISEEIRQQTVSELVKDRKEENKKEQNRKEKNKKEYGTVEKSRKENEMKFQLENGKKVSL